MEFKLLHNPASIKEGRKMLEVIERSHALRRLLYTAIGIGWLYGVAALLGALAPYVLHPASP